LIQESNQGTATAYPRRLPKEMEREPARRLPKD
jgi:hypothetical protein